MKGFVSLNQSWERGIVESFRRVAPLRVLGMHRFPNKILGTRLFGFFVQNPSFFLGELFLWNHLWKHSFSKVIKNKNRRQNLTREM